jgi:hypothetical protein
VGGAARAALARDAVLRRGEQALDLAELRVALLQGDKWRIPQETEESPL